MNHKVSSQVLRVVAIALLFAVANPAIAGRETLALGRNLDTSLLDEAIRIPSEELIEFIEKSGVEVYLYPSRVKRNPAFANGKMVSARMRDEKILRDIFEDSGGGSTIGDAGVFFPKIDPAMGHYGTFIVIAESANVHTLLHEFTHFIFYLTEKENPGTLSVHADMYGIAQKAIRAHRVLELQMGYGLKNYISTDVYKRENLVEVLLEDMKLESQRVHWFVAEEVIVEALLAARIGSKSSIHFSEARSKEGQKYALRNIKGAQIGLGHRLNNWDELKQSFFRTAGAHPHTSNAEREEILDSIPRYQEMINEVVSEIESKLSALQKVVSNVSGEK
ncbi:MAG: hypothetical protein J0L82_19650 [Deltaproteobacteria bacterium]|nr:hypothetical protein [Deltaproteobacteria bacterium]